MAIAMFTERDVARLRRMGDVIRIKRRSVDREPRRTWADDLADRLQAWIDAHRKDDAA